MSPSLRVLRLSTLGALVLAVALVALGGVSSAQAASSWWQLDANAAPTILQPGHEGQIVLSAADVGDQRANGEATPITITDVLPQGLKVEGPIRAVTGYGANQLTCSTEPGGTTSGETVTCKYEKELAEFEVLQIYINVQVGAEPGKPLNEVKIEGGGVPSETLSRPVQVGAAETQFGIDRFELNAENEGGSTDTQAGSHPFQLATLLDLNQQLENNVGAGEKVAKSPALLKELQVKLPPGLVGDTNPAAIPQCSGSDFSTIEPDGASNRCPSNTAIGVAIVSINEPVTFRATHRVVPVFSLKPAPGEPARFGFEVLKVTVVLDTAVLTGGDYSVLTSVKNASQGAQVLGSQLFLWGEPGAASHDSARGWPCLVEGQNVPKALRGIGCTPATRLGAAFLSLPTSCSDGLHSEVLADSWREPGPAEADGTAIKDGNNKWKEASWDSPHLEGCERLPFEPSISVEPETHAGNTPSGLTVNVHEPQASTIELGGLAASAIKETTVTLPTGVLLSPSAANGLEACSTGLAGVTRAGEFGPGAGSATFTRHLPEPLEPGTNFCPNGSKVGVVHINTPDLPNEIEGGVYLAQQNANPFGSLFAMYIVAEDPVSKVLVKLAGEIHLDTGTGRITTTFKNTPQLPFEDLKLELFGGPRASITTPPTCGAYTTEASFVPWSTPTVAHPASSTFNVTSGPEGGGCTSPLPLTPGFKAGSTSTGAGAFTGFDLTLTRPDSNQTPTSLSVRLPPGLAALLSSVTLCPEAQASQGTCDGTSLIGHATATAGLGSQPFTETGGRVYITGPYNGAPFGLSVVIPTKAGPFDFGNVVTRSSLSVDPSTAAVTIDSALPTMVNTTSYQTGVPVQLKQIHVTVDRPGFQFNPTNCSPMTVSGTLRGAQGGSASVSSAFQVANCASLPFAPKLSATAGGQASKLNGANLNVKVTSAGLGQANIAKVFLTLPKALPSRLTTIQKACVDSVFNANPAGCDEGSVIGKATIHTPVLKSALSGPAYLVAHGNAAFPDVEFVLTGEGITLVLDGKTDIKKGVTYSRFESTPDAPFTSFETELPTGPHSALTANVPENEHYSLCKTKLVMPTEITAQNGAVIKQETKIGLTNCVAGFQETRTQKLHKALKACRKHFKHNKKKRVACERKARKRYGAKHVKKHSSKKHTSKKKK